MTVAGKTLVGTTLGIAALNGSLLTLGAAAGIGYGTYKMAKKMMAEPVDAIYSKAERDMKARVEKIQDKELRSKAERQLKKDLAALEKTRAADDLGRNEACKWLGIGVFAYPPAAVLAGAGLVAKNLLSRR